MQLRIEDQTQTLIDIRDFRKTHDLPDTFGVALFEPKDYSGLASIEQGGEALQTVREMLLEVIAPEIRFMALLPYMEQLTKYFRVRLNLANDQIKLRDTEIDFAVNGFSDLSQQIAYEIIHAHNTRRPMPEFDPIYQHWLNTSVRISQRVHEYDHNGTLWKINIINTIYGRAGLIINAGEAMYYVRDAALACPAQGYMYNLMKAVCERVGAAIVA